MIIQLFSDTFRRGYLPKFVHTPVSVFFGGANVAFRRATLADIGGWDETLAAGEDIDISVRGAQSEWELYFLPEARVEHWGAATLRALARQWYGYGFHHARLFKKHATECFSILALNPNPRAYRRYTTMFHREPSRIRAIVFVSSFTTMHAALLAAGAAAAVGALPVSGAALAVAGASAALYFKDDLGVPGGPVAKLRHAAIRYVMNAALVGGGLLGGIKERYLFVYGTVWKRRSATAS